jgi:hypothetical protein
LSALLLLDANYNRFLCLCQEVLLSIYLNLKSLENATAYFSKETLYWIKAGKSIGGKN